MHNGIWFSVIVRDDERAIVNRNGTFLRFVAPGRFVAFDPLRRLSAEIFKVSRTELAADRALLLERTQPQLAADNLEIVRAGPNELVIVALDGEPKHVVLPNMTRAFWAAITEVAVERIDVDKEMRLTKAQMDKFDVTRWSQVAYAVVDQHEVGLLFINGAFKERLAPGRHAFWQVGRTVKIVKVDLRPNPLEVTAQEILTKDRIALRVTLTAFTRVVDPEKSVMAATDTTNTVYRLIQFAIREAVAGRTLDEILAGRATIDQEVRAYVTARAGDLGIAIGEIGVKDVILPGDVRELINKVVEAERMAKANLIRRQEETAATRSLLNTARLMEDNPLLLRLKELEALEKLVEKVGKIDLHSGAETGALQTLLSGLYRMKGATADPSADKPG